MKIKNETTETESYSRPIETLKTRLFLYGQEGYFHKLFKELQFSGRDICLLFFRYQGDEKIHKVPLTQSYLFMVERATGRSQGVKKSLGQVSVRK